MTAMNGSRLGVKYADKLAKIAQEYVDANLDFSGNTDKDRMTDKARHELRGNTKNNSVTLYLQWLKRGGLIPSKDRDSVISYIEYASGMASFYIAFYGRLQEISDEYPQIAALLQDTMPDNDFIEKQRDILDSYLTLLDAAKNKEVLPAEFMLPKG